VDAPRRSASCSLIAALTYRFRRVKPHASVSSSASAANIGVSKSVVIRSATRRADREGVPTIRRCSATLTWPGTPALQHVPHPRSQIAARGPAEGNQLAMANAHLLQLQHRHAGLVLNISPERERRYAARDPGPCARRHGTRPVREGSRAQPRQEQPVEPLAYLDP
jgi:hypothetical protein